MLASLFGEPDSISGKCMFLKNSIDANGTLVASYPEMIAVLNYSKITDGVLPCQIQGENGYILFDKASRPTKVTVHLRDGSEQTFDFKDDHHDMYYELSDFVDAVNGKNIDIFNEYTKITLSITDKARKLLNIDFTKNH